MDQPLPLTEDQQRIFDLVLHTNKNCFISGKPGVGKSVLTRALKEARPAYRVGAPTGLAAKNAGGSTLHSIFRIPVSDGIIPPTYNKFPIDDRTVNAIRYGVKALIIDEISMVRADTLDYIDRCLRHVKQKDAPFGGIQVIAVGDFFQLPPVTKGLDKKALRDTGYDSIFAFSAKVWDTFEPLELTEVLRQKGDDTFINILHGARTGDVTPKDMVALNKRVEATPTDIRPQLTATNAEADAINNRELAKLGEPSYEFSADAYGDWPNNGFPADTILTLKVGAQVLIKMNAADRPPKHKGEFLSTVVNGDLGVVVAVNKEGPEGPTVSVLNRAGETITIYRKQWERKVKEEVNGTWEERVTATFNQIPLTLAWAISMHKSQGQSFDVVHINAAKVFTAGQLYVALSRCRTLAGVTLEQRISREQFKTDPYVQAYYKQLTLTQHV